MARSDHPSPTQLDRDLVELKLLEIAQGYREVLDEAARKGSSMLEWKPHLPMSTLVKGVFSRGPDCLQFIEPRVIR